MKNTATVSVKYEVKLTLNEVEARALEALIGYGFEDFKEVFYKKLGAHYMQPHESGLKSVFEGIDIQIRPQLAKIDEIKKLVKAVQEGGQGG